MLSHKQVAALDAFRITVWLRFLRRLEPRQQLLLSVRSDPIFSPASSSRPAPSTVGLGDGIPSADAPPPASAEPLSPDGSPAIRFVAIKVWATRIGVIALVAVGFGTFALAITQSVIGLAIGAAVGAALSAKRAMRITADDIRF